jgi:hypothetical protein
VTVRSVGPGSAGALLEPECRAVGWRCRRGAARGARVGRQRDPRPVGAERAAGVWLSDRVRPVGPGWARKCRTAGGSAVHPRFSGTVALVTVWTWPAVLGVQRLRPRRPLRPGIVGVPAGGRVLSRIRRHACITRARRRPGGSHGPLVPMLQVVATLSRVGDGPRWCSLAATGDAPGPGDSLVTPALPKAAPCRPLYQPGWYCLASSSASRTGQSTWTS